MPEKTWLLWDNAVPRVPSVLEHEFSQSGKSMSYEHVCLVTANSGPVADVKGWDQLRVRVDCGPGPYVAGFGRGRLCSGDVFRLGVDEAPNLIHLDTLAGQIPERPVHIGRKRLPGVLQQLHDRVFADAGQPRDRPDGHTLNHHPHDLG